MIFLRLTCSLQITTNKEVKFAIEQPYFHIVSDTEALFEHFEEDQLTLNSINFKHLKGIDFFSFFVCVNVVFYFLEYTKILL